MGSDNGLCLMKVRPQLEIYGMELKLEYVRHSCNSYAVAYSCTTVAVKCQWSRTEPKWWREPDLFVWSLLVDDISSSTLTKLHCYNSILTHHHSYQCYFIRHKKHWYALHNMTTLSVQMKN